MPQASAMRFSPVFKPPGDAGYIKSSPKAPDNAVYKNKKPPCQAVKGWSKEDIIIIDMIRSVGCLPKYIAVSPKTAYCDFPLNNHIRHPRTGEHLRISERLKYAAW
ncbi:hypothetical protein C7B09_09220 [Escherichia albertii]|uniref:Uncharacterized protein n=1 Tax=Escherichia albertii TaxID=208962 RepID=A0ABX5HJY8_ESCAL|nr:hypothetical protein C7B09_09220 [Escherichia albertii]